MLAEKFHSPLEIFDFEMRIFEFELVDLVGQWTLGHFRPGIQIFFFILVQF